MTERTAARTEIPTPYIFTLDTPLVLFQGRLLQPRTVSINDDNYLEFSPNRFGLEDIVSAKELEELYFLHNTPRFEQFQAHYIQSNIRRELRASASVRQEVIDNKVLSFIVNDVLPLITAEKFDNDVEEILVQDKQDQDYMRQSPRGHLIQNDPHSRSHNRQRHDASNPSDAANEGWSREVIAEARRLKSEFLKKLDHEYAPYETRERHSRPGNRSGNIDDRVSEIFGSQNPRSRSRPIEIFNDGSILNTSLQPGNILFIGSKVYDIVSVNEFLSYFREYMRPALYRTLMAIEPTKDPAEINAVIKQNILDVDKKCRSRIRNKLKSSMLKIDGSYYIPFLKENSSQFREGLLHNYSMLIEKRIKSESFDKYERQTKELFELAEEKKRLNDVSRRSRYERKGAGFETIDGQYFVYITTPAYALRSPHISSGSRYVAFPAAKIGVSIKYYGHSLEFGNPVIMSDYRHPFLGDGNAFKSICLGDRGSLAANNFRKLKPEQTVLALLDQGKKTLMMGYKTGSNPYLPLMPEYRWSFISKDDVRRRGLVCLNDETVGEKNGR